MTFRHTLTRAALTVVLTGATFIANAHFTPQKAHAESACMSAPSGDVDAFGVPKNDSMVDADIVALCASHTPTDVQVSIRTNRVFDFTKDPALGAGGFLVTAGIDTNRDGSSEYRIKWFRDGQGTVSANVHTKEGDQVVCPAVVKNDGVRYTLKTTRACVGDPAQIGVAGYAFKILNFHPNGEMDAYSDALPKKQGAIGPLGTALDFMPNGVNRLSGNSRVQTATRISENQYSPRSADSVVLARQGDFPDALAAACLARAKNGPVILTQKDSLHPEAQAEIQRVLSPGKTVYIAGGNSAISPNVEAQVKALGFNIRRLSGPSRVETATAIADEAKFDPRTIVVADGREFADALIAGSLASHLGGVQLLTNGNSLHPANEAWLRSHPGTQVIAIGKQAKEALGSRATKSYAMSNPMLTSLEVAKREYANPTIVGIANGTKFPDGLAGGPNIAKDHGPLLLSYPDVLPNETLSWLGNQRQVTQVRGYGGEAVLSNQLLKNAANKNDTAPKY